jgi:ABC-type transport system involved in multi-copper enzyme maturation permease subunit
MIKAIIWKDIRLQAIALIGQLVVMLIPPLLYALIVLTDQEDLQLTTLELRRQLSDVCFFMAVACLLITPVLGAIPLARERRERTCDFLATAPIARGTHITSKLLVTALLIAAAPLACLMLAYLIAPPSSGSPEVPVVRDREVVTAFALAFLALGGVAWFFGSCMRSEAVAAGCTFLVVVTASLALVLFAERSRIDSEKVFQWYLTLLIVTGTTGLLSGTTIAFVRRAW